MKNDCINNTATNKRQKKMLIFECLPLVLSSLQCAYILCSLLLQSLQSTSAALKY